MHSPYQDDFTRPHTPLSRGDTQPHHPAGYGLSRRAYQRPPGWPPYRTKHHRKGTGCFGYLLQGALALGLFAVAFVLLAVVMYRLAPPPRLNILILGLDSRPGEGVAARTDTMILATIDPAQPYVGMLAIPRDLWVDIPGYGKQRINAAHVFAEVDNPGSGPALARRTVEHNFGVPIHRYVRLDFEGFIAIVDAAGGITVDVERHLIDYEYPTYDYGVMTVEFRPGRQHLDGERALQYARLRHGTGSMDRLRRQMQVIAALFRQLLWPGNWGRLPAVYLAFVRHVDTDLAISDFLRMAPAVLWVGPQGIDSRTFDETMYYARTTEAGAAIQEPIWEGIRPVVDEMFRR